MFRDVVHSLGSTAPIRKVLTLGHVTNRCAPLTATHRRLRDPPYISLSFLHVFSFAHPTLYLLLSDSQIVRYLFHPPASSSPHPYQTQPMSSHISSSGSTGHEISSVPSSAPSARSAAPLSAATTEPPSVAPSQSVGGSVRYGGPSASEASTYHTSPSHCPTLSENHWAALRPDVERSNVSCTEHNMPGPIIRQAAQPGSTLGRQYRQS
jgi:hypothetical protein